MTVTIQAGTPRRGVQASTATPDASARRPYLNLPEQLQMANHQGHQARKGRGTGFFISLRRPPAPPDFGGAHRAPLHAVEEFCPAPARKRPAVS
jgi:hypothetical protein